MAIAEYNPTRSVWGGTYAHLCGTAVQTYTDAGGRQGLFDAGCWQRHSCGPIRACGCGEYVCTWRTGAVVNIADDAVHVCGQGRVSARRVLVPIARPVNAVANQPAPAPPAASLDRVLDLEDDAA
jgi:hypothetical protein